MTVTLSGAIALAQPAPPPPDATPPAPADAAPPAPPAPGSVAAPEPPAPVPSPFPPEGESPDERMDQVGFRINGGFFIRDSRDNFRLHPFGLFDMNAYGFMGPGVNKVPSADTSVGLKPRLFIRRARIGFEGELLKRWSFAAVLEFGGQPIGNIPGAAGPAETTAGKPGTAPTAASARYAPIESITSGAFPADVFINYSACKCFNITIGQFNSPITMDLRTGDLYHPLLERNVAIRSFITGNQPRDLGGIIWGELGPRVFVYELGVFGGDGQNRPSVDARVDFMGRIFARPFAGVGSSDLAKFTQIGVSARHGDRDPSHVGYDYAAMTTGQGFVLWKPTYTDSLGRQVHIIPSGAQNMIGGELRTQVGRFAIQGEAYYLANNTREAVDGYQLTNTERLGRIKGVGWYAQASVWPVGDPFIGVEPGIFRPRHVDLKAKDTPHIPKGLEIIALAAGINANYKGGSRLGSTDDAKTPSGDITIYQIGGAVNYWHTRHVRVGIDYFAYLTPGSGTASNTAVVPDNLVKAADGTAGTGHVLHELGGRMAIAF
ncbi:MAG: porin [Minicystis sp.]